MQKIVPSIWLNKNALEAAEFYVSVFKNSKMNSITKLENTPSGDGEYVAISIEDLSVALLGAGPEFRPNPSISFLVAYQNAEEIDDIWKKFLDGGKILMEIGEYPFSPKYGWIEDKYGASWQLMLDDGHYPYKHKITPSFLFVGEVAGKAEEAMNFYTSIFPDSKVGDISRYSEGMGPDKPGTVMHGAFTLAGQEFFAMDSAHPDHKFKFNEGLSLEIHCIDQEEIDYFWEKLSSDPTAEICGWVKDKYGVSWQIIPHKLDEMMRDGDQERANRVTQAMLKMKKLNIAELEKAYQGD